MIPYFNQTGLGFIIWLSERHPKCKSISNLDPSEYNIIIDEFGNYVSSHLESDKDAQFRWKENIDYLKNKGKDYWLYVHYKKCYDRLQGISIDDPRQGFISTFDPLTRYRDTPIHSILLYNKGHTVIYKFVVEHWNELCSLSGNNCDIYILISLIEKTEDIYMILRDLKTLGFKNLPKQETLPGILFWDDKFESNYFISLKSIHLEDLEDKFKKIFSKIDEDKTIAAVRNGYI